MYCIKKTKIMYRQTVIKVYKKKKAKQNVFKINEKINISRMITKKEKKAATHLEKVKENKKKERKEGTFRQKKRRKKKLKTITSVTKTKNQGKKEKEKKKSTRQ